MKRLVKKILAIVLFVFGSLFFAVGIGSFKTDVGTGIVALIMGVGMLIYPALKIRDHASRKKTEGSKWLTMPIVAIAIPLIFTIISLTADVDSNKKENLTETSETTAVQNSSDTTATSSETKSECELQGHKWKDADCTTPKTCTVCGLTEGEPLNHDWKDATCTEAKTCARCGATEGDPLGHDTPKLSCTEGDTCTRCGQTFEALGHDWLEATCSEPKTCSRCGETEGKATGHIPAEAVNENVVPASCTEEGSYDEVVYCSVCHEELSRTTKKEEALGHTTKSGVCDRCGNEVYETVEGKGDDVITDITVGDGLYRVHLTNSGSSNFAVWIHYADGDRDLAANEIGNYDGYAFLDGEGPYTFEIKSSGKWTYTIDKLELTGRSSFSGVGAYVTDIFTSITGKWHLTHDGSSNFAVWFYTSEGRDLLVNVIGEYDGNCYLEFPKDGLGVLVIEADGNWKIEPAE